MPSTVDLTFVSLLALVLLVAVFMVRRQVAKHRAEAQKYRLFKVRDDLIYLVGQGKLSEDDLVYQYFYRAANSALKHTHHFTLKNFVAALRTLRRDGADPAEECVFAKIREALQGKDPEVQRAAHDYYGSILEILVENSWQIPLLDRVGALASVFRKVAAVAKVHSPQREAYGFYLDYDRALHA